jgi:hypothetical protein
MRECLGISNGNVLSRWKKETLARSGVLAISLETRVKQPESELRRVAREREVLAGIVSRRRGEVIRGGFASGGSRLWLITMS